MNVHVFPPSANHDDDSAPTKPQVRSVRLPAKAFAMSVSPSRVVVAMARRCVNIYSLSDLVAGVSPNPDAMSVDGDNDDDEDDDDDDDEVVANDDKAIRNTPRPMEPAVEPWQRRESSLRFMTRAVACMPTDDGYASSSIEGRVAVEWFDDSAESQARKYAFKCHRQTQALADFESTAGPDHRNGGSTNGAALDEQQQQQQQVDVVYPVNALAFHPVHGTFASGGGDGSVALWDGIAKRRIRQYHRFDGSVMAMQFDGTGRRLAVGVSPGFEDGIEDEDRDRDRRRADGGGGSDGASSSVTVYIRLLDPAEAKPKKK